jgi:hypothetical protein
VTLPSEIALYRKGFKPTYLILTVGRYYSLVNLVLDVAFNLVNGATPQFCHNIRWVLPFLSTTIQFASIPLLLLRTYAIWGGNQTIAVILVIFWIGPLIIGTYASTTYEGVPYSLVMNLNVVGGCGNDPTNNWGTAPFIVNMIVDASVFLLTLGRLLSMRSASAVAGSTIRRVLIRHGIIYYIVVVMINVANIVFFLAPGLPPLARPLIATPATMIPTIMAGRLFFNLQQNFLSSSPAPSSRDSNPKAASNNISASGHSRKDDHPLRPVVNYTVDVSTDDQSFMNAEDRMLKGGSII